MAETRIDISDAIDRQRIGSFQRKIVGLCAIIAALEGFNTQSVGYIAPALARDLSLQPRDLGLLFSLGLFGLLCGALLIAPLADRFGRRRVLLFCVPLLGIFTVLTAFSVSATMLDGLRFLTGLAIGGALPNTIALTSEYAPSRRRAITVAIMFSGFVAGSIAAGITAGLLAAFGWKWVFWVGGSLCLVLSPVIASVLPESIRFMVLKQADQAHITRLVNRLFPQLQLGPDIRFTAAAASASPASLRALFEAGRFRRTLLLWIISFASLFDIFLMSSWLPTEIRSLGFPITFAILAATTFQIGGLFGIVFGWLADRIGANVALALAYLTGALGVFLIPVAGASPVLVIGAIAGAGFGIVGGQGVANAVSAIVYPTEIRSTGVGWFLGIGRVGSIIGPGIAGMLLQISIPAREVILLAAFPALIAAAAAFALDPISTAFTAKAQPLA